jgi:hydroxyacid-oxoacid transhydrogenase
MWAAYALERCVAALRPAVFDADSNSREQLALASSAAGVGFGNAGVHLCHAMSYPISSRVAGYRPASGYEGSEKASIVPHGLSVVLTAPEIFRWTADADPERHLTAARIITGDRLDTVRPADAGPALADAIVHFLDNFRAFVPDGLAGVNYTTSDVDVLVAGTLPQRKVLDVAPKQATAEDLAKIFERSMAIF